MAELKVRSFKKKKNHLLPKPLSPLYCTSNTGKTVPLERQVR